MRISLGKLELTKNQILNIDQMHSEIIKSVLVKGDEVFVEVTKELSREELTKLLSDLEKLPNRSPDRVENKKNQRAAVLTKLGITEAELKLLF